VKWAQEDVETLYDLLNNNNNNLQGAAEIVLKFLLRVSPLGYCGVQVFEHKH
jgi:hypothetical protein